MSSRAGSLPKPWRRSSRDEHSLGLSGLEKSLAAPQPWGSSALGLLSLAEKSWSHSNPCHISGHLHTRDPGLKWKGAIMHEGLQRNFTCPATCHRDAHKVPGPVLHPLLLLIAPQTTCPALPHPQFSTCVSKEPSEEIKFNKSTLC